MPVGPTPAAATLVPADTLVFVQVPDFKAARHHFAASSVFALWQEPQVQAFLAGPVLAARESLDARSAMRLSRSFEQILRAPQGPAFLAVTSLNFPPTQPGLIIGADVKGNLFKVKLAALNLEFNLRRYNRERTILVTRSYQGVRYKVWRVRADVSLCYTFLGSMVVVTVGEEPMHTVIAHVKRTPGPNVDTLAGSAAYHRFVDALPAEHDAIVYLNPGPVLRNLGPLMLFSPPRAAAFRPIVGIAAAGLSLQFTPTAVRETQVTQFHPRLHQPPPPNTRQTLRFTNPDTLVYAVRSIEFADAYDRIMPLIELSRQPRLNQMFAAFEQQLRQGDINLRDDVLAKLGPEVALLVNWRDTAELPDTALVIQVSDLTKLRAPLEQTLDLLKQNTLGDDSQAPWEDLSYRGYQLRVTHLGAGKIAPTYFFADGFLVLASDPDFARELIAHIARSGPMLAANPDYQAAVRQVPAGNGAFCYCDTATLYQRAWPLAREISEEVAAGLTEPGTFQTLPPVLKKLTAKPWVDWVLLLHQLPSPSDVMPHLGPFVSATQDEPICKTTVSLSPFGTPTGLLAIGVTGLAGPEVFAMLRRPFMPPTAPRRLSGKIVLPVPRGNQTEASQIPPTP